MTRAAILLLVFLGALAGAGWAGYAWRGTEVANLKREHAQAIADARAAALAEAARITHRIQEAQDAEFLRRTAAETEARRAAVAGQRLRDELAETRRWFEGLNTSIAFERQAANRAVTVLTDLLGQCSERRRELAQYADQAASAGRVCERSWPKD